MTVMLNFLHTLDYIATFKETKMLKTKNDKKGRGGGQQSMYYLAQ